MEGLINGVILYHGSYCEVQSPDLKKCAKYKDFGQGFYLTTSLEQARNFAKLSTRKAKANGIVDSSQGYGIVSSFEFSVQSENQLDAYLFETANAEWLHCVVGHRKVGSFLELVNQLEKYDIIGGKIADDSTNATITAYMVGTFGRIGTDSADNMCISLLLPDRLKDQFCFRTKEALDKLRYLESEKIWL